MNCLLKLCRSRALAVDFQERPSFRFCESPLRQSRTRGQPRPFAQGFFT
jgi:hypothetical protein